jgi:hypothetical protein
MKKLILCVLFIVMCIATTSFGYTTVRLGPEYFPETSRGRPIALGSIYVGQPDLDPEIVGNQKTLSVQQEDGTIVAVTQPIYTNAGGVPVYSGSPVTLLVEGTYSLKVLDSSDAQVYYVPSTTSDGIAQDNCYPSYAAVDQGLTGDNDTLKYCIDTIGADQATIVLRHNSGAATTTYTLTTSETIPANVTLKVERGVVIDGVGTLTLESQPELGLYKVFGTVTIAGLKVARAEWFGENTSPGTTDMKAAIQSAVDSIATAGGEVLFDSSIYLIEGINIPGINASRTIDGVKVKSNIIFRGVGWASEIRQSVNCYNTFATHINAAITNPVTDANQVKNIAFYNIRFTQPTTPGTWAQEKHILNLESVTGLIVRDCFFIGWSGDAMYLGITTKFDTSAFYQAFLQNVTIDNNYFDGVDKNNRQAISLMCGEDIQIINNHFTRTTRSDMPGAIDVEPEGTWPLIRGIRIQGNTFQDIGGGVGTVTLVLGGMTVAPSNISVLDNTFKDNTSIGYEWWVGGTGATDQTAIHADSPYKIRFAGNTLYNTTSRVMRFGGLRDVTVENNLIVKNPATVGGVSYWGLDDGATGHYPIDGFKFKNNTVRGVTVNGASPVSPFEIYGSLLGGEISGNMFIDCGNHTAAAYGDMNVVRFSSYSAPSYGVTVEGNTFINTGDYSATSVPLVGGYPSVLTYPETFSVRDNSFAKGFNYNAYRDVQSLYGAAVSDYSPNVMTLSNVANPAIGGGRIFLTGGATDITEFRFGKTGQIITIIAEHALTITDGTNIFLAGSANFVMAATDTLTLIQKADGKLYELSRSDNT